ncbi:MAG: MscL family protein [Minisyncoccia bacterium]
MKDFIDFIRTQGVVGLAIGFILGGAVSKTVSAIVNDLVNPIISIILNRFGDLKLMSSSIRGVNIMWGDLIGNLIDLVVISAVVYYGVKLLKIEKLDKKI